MAKDDTRAPRRGGPTMVDRAAETIRDSPEPPPSGRIARIKAWLGRHKMLLWWGHSAYALFLGVMVIIFAQKGFEYARVLAATLGGAFIGMILVFRLFGHGVEQKERVEEKKSAKVRFLLMTYVLKNLYQGMLFFLLPFYWKSSSLDSINGWFVILLGVLAFLSTMDIIFDHILMRYRVIAASYYTITLFACMNLVIPAFFPNVRTLVTLLSSAALAVLGFWLMHYPLKTLRDKKTWLKLGGTVGGFVLIVFFCRVAIPPVPLYVTHAAVGPEQLADGRLKLEVGRLHHDALTDMFAVSDVALPGGEGDVFHHVWRHRDGDFRQTVEARRESVDAKGIVRLSSALVKKNLPGSPIGDWTVDVVTEDGQIVGRARFTVIQ